MTFREDQFALWLALARLVGLPCNVSPHAENDIGIISAASTLISDIEGETPLTELDTLHF